ncbi:MAG TPA: primosomal protein N' [Solirubrobacteraceae bacterium]|jgi:primosomal protein N' (replication factor Y)|nr:primosomal protein N' [Solirubrobacteraceae bacterium]
MTTARALRGPFDYRLSGELSETVTVGSMLVVPFGRREILGVVTALAERSEVSEERLLAPLRALDEALPVDLISLAQWLAGEYCSTLARALALVLPPAATRRLSGRKRRNRPALPEHIRLGVRSAEPPTLTAEQSAALSDLVMALRSGQAQTRLLAGITGSGKTEVYLRACAETLRQGRGAIVLVPEIALTTQIVGRFVERFGDTVAVLHSRLTVAQRREQWRRLRAGEARVCVGPRSAVFAPIERLGLIVVDEEHDSSYKHEGDPRYDARAVAARRASDCGALLLLGSATPRPESAHEAKAALRLARRVDGRALPQVRVLDMRKQPPGLHPLTAEALREVRAARGKAIVLLNRRGWSNFLSCRECGRVWGCPECDVALVLHRAHGILACHHCGHREQVPQRCTCGSMSLARHGAGTERVQHELAATLDDGNFPIFRLDADTLGGPGASKAGKHTERAPGVGVELGAAAVGELLGRFEAAPAGVLIGTQMVAKGHDFADVTLGVVLDADATLRFPDFRAEERTFALVTQLAGRVGRGNDGHVLVQSIAPEARSIVHAAAHDSDGFLAGELERRRALGYPPFSSLIRVVCSAEHSARSHSAAAALRERLAGCPGGILGPAGLFRLRGRERQVLVIKAPPEQRSRAIALVGAAVAQTADSRAHRDVNFSVDVDPQ